MKTLKDLEVESSDGFKNPEVSDEQFNRSLTNMRIKSEKENTPERTENPNTVYNEQGYESREDYLSQLAENYNVDEETVLMLADLLGENEDFDGLVSAVQDIAE